MPPLRWAGALAATAMTILAGSTRVEAFPWPKHHRVVVGSAPVVYQAPAASAPVVYQAPAASAPVVYQAPAASAPVVFQAPAAAAPTAAQAPTTINLTPAAAAPTAGTSQVYINGQLYTIGSSGAAPGAAPSDRCELSAEDEAALIADLRSYRREELKDTRSSGDVRRDLIDQAMMWLEDYCDTADEGDLRVKARHLVYKAMGAGETTAAAAARPTTATGYVIGGSNVQPPLALPVPYAAPVMPLIQPVVPVILQPVAPRKCFRCLHRAFCPHQGY